MTYLIQYLSIGISILNRKLQKLVNVFPHAHFLETDNNRNLFNNHGLHLNKLGKQLVNHQIASLLLTILKKTTTPIILRWHETQDDNNQTCDVNQVKPSNRNSIHNRKIPVTRSNDFLW